MITNKDTNMMIDLLITAYGDKSFPVDDPKKLAKVMNLWSVMFQDDEPKEVLLAVKNCIATLQYPPRVADIKSRIAQIRMAGQMTEMQAWVKIRKAVKKSGTSTDANAAFAQLPGILKRLVVEPGTLVDWHRLSIDTLEGVIASNTQRSYRELARNEAEYYALPKDMQTEQSWMVEEPEVNMLPEPKPQKSMDEVEADREKKSEEYRDRFGIEPNHAYDDRVAAFKAPLSTEDLKRMEYAERKKEALLKKIGV